MRTFPERVEAELRRARTMFPKFNSAHEGAAIIREEYEELWDEIKKTKGALTAQQRDRMAGEVTQLGAMCQRFYEDVLDA